MCIYKIKPIQEVMGGGRDMKYKTEVTKLNYYNCICMVTAVSGFTEQVSNMVKRIPKHNYYPSTRVHN